jgi:hypothetical protein
MVCLTVAQEVACGLVTQDQCHLNFLVDFFMTAQDWPFLLLSEQRERVTG